MIDDHSEGLGARVEEHARKRQRMRRLSIGTVVVTALGLGGYWLLTELPERAIEQAKQRALDCVNAIYESGEGDAGDCRQAGLGLARTLPWTRDAALQELAEIERLVLEHQLDLASVRDVDARAREQAGRELVELHRSSHPPQGGNGAIGRLDSVGAIELMVELASAEESTNERRLALNAALMLGDWEAAGRLAKTSAEGDMSFAQNAAIVACILGDRETAAARLREADLAWREHQDSQLLDLLLIEAHCGLPPASDEPLDSYMTRAVQLATSLYEPGAALADGYHPHELAMTVARMAVAQEPIVWDEKLRTRDVELLETIGAPHGFRLAPVLTRTRDERAGAGGPVIVSELEAGARRLAELFAAAPREHTFESAAQTIQPRASLAWGGFCLASMAAAERVWRGQLEEARAIHAVARELAASEEFRALGIGSELRVLGQYALLDPEEALRVARAVTEEALAATPADSQAVYRTQLALVYEQAGELDRAIELSTGAFELLPQVPSDGLVSMGIAAGVPWVHGALLLRAGREGSLQVEAPPNELRGGASESAEVFAYWWTAALAEPSAQVGYRWRASGESGLWLVLEPWSLASSLELLARSGPEDRRDLWLDVVSADIVEDPLDMIRARVTAAERLGDAAAAERWRAREEALLERLREDRAAALYRMLE